MNLRTILNKSWLILVLAGLFLAACSSGDATPTAEPVSDAEFKPVVSATGVVVPREWVPLSMSTAGNVAEVLVAENDMVSAEDVLVRLQGEENLQAAIETARFEMTSAKYALDQLYDDPELKVAQAYQEVVDARIARRDAQRRLDNLNVPTPSRDIEQSRANVAILKDRMERARKDYRPFEKKPEDNLTRAALLSKLAQIEKQYNDAVRKLNNQLGTINELDLDEATADLQMAEARLQTAERDYELKKAGPDPEDVALAEARIDNAQAQLNAAEAALDDLLLLAPIAGTVTELSVKPGEWIAPGQPLLQIADLSELHIETTDLNEIDVARVNIGDPALVTFDAMPDDVLDGKVTRIAPKASPGTGVNYTVWIELDEIPDSLRWGMTAFVDIEVGP